MGTSIDLDTLLKLIAKINNISELFVPALIAVIAWLGQKYFSFVTNAYQYNATGITYANVMRSHINENNEEYRKVFTEAWKHQTFAGVKKRHRTKQNRPLLLASSYDTHLYETIKREVHSLPFWVAGPCLQYFAKEALFEKSYALLGSREFADADLEAKKACIDECKEESDACVAYGQQTVETLRQQTHQLIRNNILIVGFHALVLIWIVAQIIDFANTN